MAHVIHQIVRPEKALVAQLAQISPATAHEAMGKKGAMDSRIKPIYSGMRVCGPVLTVRCHPGDNIMLHKAIAMAEPGDVIVATVGHSEAGYWGEVMTTVAQDRGVGGLVIDGCVRDGLDLKKRGFPAFATGLCMKGTVKETLGSVNETICCGGVTVRPGDLVLGDDDGVVVIPRDQVREVLAKSQQKKAREEALMKKIASEHLTTLELDELDKVLAAKGCVEE